MAGLLDQFASFAQTPEGQGLLAATFGGLAGARRGQPINSLGRAGLAGLAGYSGAQDRITQEAESATQRRFREMQMQGLEAQMARQVAQDKWRAGLGDVLSPKPQEIDQFTGTTQMVEPSREVVQKYLMDPNSPFADKLLEQKLFPKGPEYKVVGDALVGIGPDGKVAPAYTAPPKPEAAPSSVREYQYGLNDPAFNAWLAQNNKSKASNVNVTTKVENKASESVAGQVGPILEKSLTAAEGAMRVLDASDRVIKAIDSGKVITGPMANQRVTGLQIGQMLGIGGRDAAEVLANTRQAIRGLSEMTLQGRKEMSGQGAITDRESALAEKATSGDISDLTAEEVKILANASRRASQYQIQKHQSRVKNAGVLPGMQNITPFFDVPAMEPAPAATPTVPVAPFADPNKEQRYQEWLRSQRKPQ